MINQILKISIFLLIYLLPLALTAQDYLFDAKLYNTEDGLANLMTTAIHKNEKGFLWIATKYGLNRFDGYHFTLFTQEKNGLTRNDEIHKIREDDQGNLWLFYFDKFIHTPDPISQLLAIDIFNPKTQKAVSIATFFENHAPFKITDLHNIRIIDAKNRLWLTTRNGEIYLFQNNQFTKIYEQEATFFQYLTVDEQDNIWLGSANQLTKINIAGKLLETHELPNLLAGIWIGENETLCVMTGNFVKIKRPDSLFESQFEYQLWTKNRQTGFRPFVLVDNSESLKMREANGFFMHYHQAGFWFIKLDGKMNVFDKEGKLLHNYQDFTKSNNKISITNFFEADENNLWLTTPLGLLKLTIEDNPFQLIHQKEGYSDCRGITEDNEGNIYFINRWINQWNPAKELVVEKKPLHGYLALTFVDSILWAGVYGADMPGKQINLRNGAQHVYQSNEVRFSNTTLKTEKPYQLLVGTDKGLVYVDLLEKKLTPYAKYNDFEILKDTEVYHIYKNKTGIWLATSKGVFLMSEKQGIVRLYNRETGDLPFDYIRHIHETKNGVFWLATKGGGIIQWNPSFTNDVLSKYRQFTTKEGLSNNYVYAIYGDNYGKLWMSSDKGLMCMDKQTFEINAFFEENGLPHNEFNLTAHYQAKDSTLYFGGLGGLISFHPRILADKLKNDAPLQFVRYHVLEEGKDEITDKTSLLVTSNSITIHPTDKFFELEFALLDFDNPDQHEYAYQIEGYSEQWSHIKENYVRIPSLPYGDYRLKVRGLNYGKGWSKRAIFLDIKVEKPFYLQNWFIVSAIIGGICLIIGIVKWRLRKLEADRKRLELEVRKRTETIQLQAQELRVLDKAKTRFFSNITHEFRTPLTLIIGPLEQVIEEQPNSNRLGSVLRNAKHLLGLINQMLDLSKLEGGQMKVELKQGDIVNYTKGLIQQIKPLADKKQQQIQFSSSKKVWKTKFDNKKWNKIIYNLLSNAIKFTPEHGQIMIDLAIVQKTNQIQLLVKDTGVGIEGDKLSNIFNRFYQTDDSSTRYQEGTGIGLALVKELVELQNGTITVESELGLGTIFKILLPILARIEAEIVEDEPALQPIKTRIPTTIVNTPASKKETSIAIEKLTLLIIEDNEEMRAYIKSCISTKNYTIEEAKNGIEGIKKTDLLIPDLIISDVMMPGKDGFEVTDFIRNNKATSHIPIILLTAKAALESRLEGIQKGADVYLTKPFSSKELRIRIEKLIEIRQLIQQSVDESSLNPVYPIYEKENLFIQEIRWIITNNINSKNLNGEFIGQQIGMSRMQVHRKMKALINQSASDMIKDMRLQKAYELLQTQNYNSSEVAYQTGFNTLAYFSKVFKAKYGCSPSELLKSVVTDETS